MVLGVWLVAWMDPVHDVNDKNSTAQNTSNTIEINFRSYGRNTVAVIV